MNYPTSFIDAFAQADDKKLSKKTFLETRSQKISYGEINQAISQMSTLYERWDLKEGDRVVVSIGNDLYACVVFLSLLCKGITAIFIDPGTKRDKVRFLIEFSSPEALVVDEDLLDNWGPFEAYKILKVSAKEIDKLTVRPFKIKRRVSDSSDSFPDILASLEGSAPSEKIDPETDAYVLFTSGTTSNPKGVRISHRALITHLKTLSSKLEYDENSRILNFLILFHADGIIQGPVITYFNKASLYRPREFDITSISEKLDSVYRHRITHLLAVPTMLSLIREYVGSETNAFNTEDFKFIISVGSQLEEELWSGFEEMFKVRLVNMYGLTETVTGGLFSGPDVESMKIGTIGKPVDCEAKIVNENDEDLPDNAPGELLMRGENIMSGYLNAAEESAKAFLGKWFRTGDIAVRDAAGFYSIVGRKKTAINTGGLLVYPEEVTEVLNLHPHVKEAVTFGMKKKIWNEVVVSAVTSDKKDLNSDELTEFCRERLDSVKVPKMIYILNELPKTSIGKITVKGLDLDSLKGIYDENGENLGVEERLIDIAASCFKVSPDTLSMETAINDTIGWDSLSHIELILKVEDDFEMKLSASEVMDIRKLNDLARIMGAHQASTNA